MTTDTRNPVCPRCHKVNRVPVDKLAAGGNCGACKQPLWPDQVLELTDQSFAAARQSGAMNQAQISQWLQSQDIR